MAEHGVPVNRVINAGGIPQKNAVLNQIYADVLDRPFSCRTGRRPAWVRASLRCSQQGPSNSIEEAQKAMCLPYRSYAPRAKSVAIYNGLYALYRKAYFALGQPDAAATPLGMLLPELRRIAAAARA